MAQKEVADITNEVRRENRRQLRRELRATLVVAAVMVVLYWVVTSQLVQDFCAGIWFRPGEPVAAMMDELDLTATGRRILRATQPAIEGREDFNQHCDSHRSELSLLGCYTDGRIYVYEITEERLRASNKVTLAHELLHAAWERMGPSEREETQRLLAKVQAENAEWFQIELAAYEETEQTEEIWTRAGTKLGVLPAALEEKYARYFRDRALVVAFYEEYQAPFRELQDRNEELRQVIFATKAEIERERDEYLAAVGSLDEKVAEFNACAEEAGCFESDEKFTSERERLNQAREGLMAERERLNAKIDENNARVEEYEANQMMLGELTEAMNSNAEEKV